MIMYKQVINLMTNEINNQVILKVDSNLFIPTDPDNTDYQAYLKWLAEGNTPEAEQ